MHQVKSLVKVVAGCEQPMPELIMTALTITQSLYVLKSKGIALPEFTKN